MLKLSLAVNLPTFRPVIACGMWNYKNPSNGRTEQILVTASYIDPFTPVPASIQFLNLHDYHEHGSGWKPGPTLWFASGLNKIIQFENEIYIFAYVNLNYKIYSLSSPTGNWTIKANTNVIAGDFFSPGMFIPSNLANCQ